VFEVPPSLTLPQKGGGNMHEQAERSHICSNLRIGALDLASRATR
jgi:hypothetical protein